MAKKIVELKGINKSFYGAKVVDNFGLTIEEGEVRCLIGENGCGKSTIIKIISGFYTYDSGELCINGKSYKKITPIEAIHEGIQVIYQDFSLFSNLTVAENVVLGNEINQAKKLVKWEARRQKAEDILESLGVSINLDKLVGTLNTAQKQLVAICRAIAQDAKLIIMDEPTAALTHKEIQSLFLVIEKLRNEGIAILFVSHKLDEVLHTSKRITVMRNGKNVYEAMSEENIQSEDLIFHMTGKRFDAQHFEYNRGNSKPILETKNIGRDGEFQNINLSLYPGEVLGITGLLGCGRTELANALFGLQKIHIGEIYIKGKPVKIGSVEDAMNNGIGYVPEDRLTQGANLNHTIGDNAIICSLDELCNKLKLFNAKKVDDAKVKYLNRFTIAGMQYRKPVRMLSGGNQQKVVLSKWLASSPEILILNCPTVGVDIGAKSDIHTIIKDLAKNGMSVIVISDDIAEIMNTCNRVLLMAKGKIVDEYDVKDINLSGFEKLLIENNVEEAG